MMLLRFPWIVLLIASCAYDAPSTEIAATRVGLEGPWQMPDDVAQIAMNQNVPYEPTPAYRSGAGCLENGLLLPGIGRLSDYVMDHFDGVTHVWDEVYCKASGGVMSQHGMGKATDLMITPIAGDADNERGDRVANWLALNAKDLGVMRIIWDDASWTAERGTINTGDFGHQDHIHVELNDQGAQAMAPWFAAGADQHPPQLGTQRPWSAEFVGIGDDGDRIHWLEGAPGGVVSLTASFRNTGSTPWQPGEVQLVALDPRDGARSELMTDRWLSASRISTVDAMVLNEDVAKFDVELRIPNATTDLYLGLVAQQGDQTVWFSGFGGPERHDSIVIVVEPSATNPSSSEGCRAVRSRSSGLWPFGWLAFGVLLPLFFRRRRQD